MPYALITGGSKGIGQAIAECLAQRHTDLLIVARTENIMAENARQWKEKYGIEVHYYCYDLRLPDAARQVFDWVHIHQWPVNILINNAGYGRWGKFNELSLDSQQKMLRINMHTLFDLTYLMIPLLQKNHPAYILNVGSMAGLQAMASLNAYAASKAFVNLFSRALHDELKPLDISVTLLSPGSVNTNFVSVSGMHHMENLARKTSMSADAVAQAAVKALFQKKKQVTPGFPNRLTAFAIKHLPKAWVEHIAASVYKLKEKDS